jgi:archaemetzincin
MKRRDLFFFISILWLAGCQPPFNHDANHPQAVQKNQPAILIAIQPYHNIDAGLVKLVSEELENFYGIRTTILPKGEMPDSCKKPYTHRYNANKILDYLITQKPPEISFILALTTHGIAIKNEKYNEWGILGLGSRPGPVCVISTANMGKDETQFKERLVKVCLHEIGHNFGLPHCTQGDAKCFMRAANGTVRTVDEEEKHLCTQCTAFLQTKGLYLP